MKVFNWGVVMMGVMCLVTVAGRAQGSFEDFRKSAEARFEKFRRDADEKYENFRRKANEDYAAFLEKAWKGVDSKPPLKRPKEDPPVVPPKPAPVEPIKEDMPIKEETPIKDKEVVIKEVVKPAPKPEPRPEPVEPIVVKPQPQVAQHEFTVFGTPMKVRLGREHGFKLSGADNAAVSRGWKQLSDQKYDALIADCLALRDKHNLSDWHYLRMLQAMVKSFLGDSNEATLLMAYVYSQSGYKMRMAQADGRLYMCYASKHVIYDESYYQLDGVNYYALDGKGKRIIMSDAAFPNEKAMSLYITGEPQLAVKSTAERNLKSTRYPAMAFDVAVNKNLIDVYGDYPTSEIGGNFMTRWAMYASTPMGKDVSSRLYPAIKKVIAGKSEEEAVQMILNWVQTAFVYEYDDKVWGGDRAFFAEETLYYPYCDCEDRSILFSRLVRDLMGLDVMLVYYPGHLATAVRFSSGDVKGDFLTLEGKRYVVCDPTYSNARVGMTMPGMNNASAKAILLPK